MYALISPHEKRGNFCRVAELSSARFDVAEPLFWVATTDGVSPDTHVYDVASQSFVATSEEPVAIVSAAELRAAAYREESDPLFFKYQRGEATMDAWLAKVAEIKSRYPGA